MMVQQAMTGDKNLARQIDRIWNVLNGEYKPSSQADPKVHEKNLKMLFGIK